MTQPTHVLASILHPVTVWCLNCNSSATREFSFPKRQFAMEFSFLKRQFAREFSFPKRQFGSKGEDRRSFRAEWCDTTMMSTAVFFFFLMLLLFLPLNIFCRFLLCFTVENARKTWLFFRNTRLSQQGAAGPIQISFLWGCSKVQVPHWTPFCYFTHE